MQLDHACIAVRSLDKAAERFCRLLGYRVATEPVENSRQQVRVLFLKKKGSLDLKLIEPSNKQSPLVDFLKKGEGLHHLAFKVDSVRSGVEELKQKKARILSEPQPGEAFCNELISFLFAGHGLNIELIDTDCRASRLDDE